MVSGHAKLTSCSGGQWAAIASPIAFMPAKNARRADTSGSSASSESRKSKDHGDVRIEVATAGEIDGRRNASSDDLPLREDHAAGRAGDWSCLHGPHHPSQPALRT